MMPSLGKEIKRLRKERSFLTQEELADKIGFSRTYLSDTESDRKIPSITFLNKVAVGLGISKLHLYKAVGYLDETDILNLIDENKRLRDALKGIQNELTTIRGLNQTHDSEITGLCMKIRKVLDGGDYDD